MNIEKVIENAKIKTDEILNKIYEALNGNKATHAKHYVMIRLILTNEYKYNFDEYSVMSFIKNYNKKIDDNYFKPTQSKLENLEENLDIWKNSNEDQRKYLSKVMCQKGRMILDKTYYELENNNDKSTK